MNSWDLRYLDVARLVAGWSKDPSTQCGAVLVRPNRTVASVGFNGFARGMHDDAVLYADRPTKYSRVIHSEWNAIQSSHDSSLEGYTVYAWPMPPCDQCTSALIQKGIRRVVCPPAGPDKLARWAAQFQHAQGAWAQRGVQVEAVDLGERMIPRVGMMEGGNKWDARFLELAAMVAGWSKDPIRPQGAVLVRPDRTVSSLGFNGFPQGLDDSPLIRARESEELLRLRESRLVQAELNAILFSQDPTLERCTAYLWPQAPDMRASVHLIHEGIRRIVFPQQDNIPLADNVVQAWREVGGELAPWNS